MGLFDFFDDKKSKENRHFGKDWFGSENDRVDAWRKDIPYNDTHDSHIWDWDNNDHDGDGYRDGSVGDSDLWDD